MWEEPCSQTHIECELSFHTLTHSECELNFALELINTKGQIFTEAPTYGRQTFCNMQVNSTDCWNAFCTCKHTYSHKHVHAYTHSQTLSMSVLLQRSGFCWVSLCLEWHLWPLSCPFTFHTLYWSVLLLYWGRRKEFVFDEYDGTKASSFWLLLNSPPAYAT